VINEHFRPSGGQHPTEYDARPSCRYVHLGAFCREGKSRYAQTQGSFPFKRAFELLISASGAHPMIHDKNLVYDVGMHLGGDTAQYLSRGFRVVAVEANPALVKRGQGRFSEEIESGFLKIVDKVIAGEEGFVDFFIHETDEWSSLYDDRWSPENTKISKHQLPSTTFNNIIDNYGLPYYIKVDIEGAESYIVDGLRKLEVRPPFISLEMCNLDFTLQLAELGYTGFQIVDQHGLAWSGPFGDLLPDAWQDAASTDVAMRKLWSNNPGDFWCDLHARL
jgi:FkbM family methyltransferase